MAAAFSASAAAICPARSLTSPRWLRQAREKSTISCPKYSLVRYVAQKNGSWPGVMNTVIGQPPCPVMAWVAVM